MTDGRATATRLPVPAVVEFAPGAGALVEGLLDESGRALSVQAMVEQVAQQVFDDGAAHPLRATPCEGAAGTTFRLDFEHHGALRTLFVKMPGQGAARHALLARRLREEFRVTREIRDAFPETPSLRTVEPAQFIESVQGFATWASPGVSLEGLLRRDCRRLGGPLDASRARAAQAAAWLNLFHRLPSPYAAADARALLDTYYDDRLVTLAALPGSGVSDRLAADLKSSLMRMLDAELAHTPVVRCHNDYSPHNMLVEGDTLCVLDFSFAGPGLPSFDVACFWHKLDDVRESALNDPARIAALQRAFVDASTTPFELGSPPAVLGLARLVLAKMITRLKEPARRPDVRFAQRRRYASWLRWLDSGFDPRCLQG